MALARYALREVEDNFRIRGADHAVADSSIFDQMNEYCLAEDFKQKIRHNGEDIPGIEFEPTKAKTAGLRITGLQLVSERLIASKFPREHPWLRVVEQDCPAFFHVMPTLQRDENNPDKLAKNANDHIYDMLHYALHWDRQTNATWSGRIDQLHMHARRA